MAFIAVLWPTEVPSDFGGIVEAGKMHNFPALVETGCPAARQLKAARVERTNSLLEISRGQWTQSSLATIHFFFRKAMQSSILASCKVYFTLETPVMRLYNAAQHADWKHADSKVLSDLSALLVQSHATWRLNPDDASQASLSSAIWTCARSVAPAQLQTEWCRCCLAPGRFILRIEYSVPLAGRAITEGPLPSRQ